MKPLWKMMMAAVALWSGVAAAKVDVVATVGDLGALAREIGGEHVSVKVFAKSTQDPHFVDARPSLVLDASNAELLILNGLELEAGWLPAILTASRNPATTAISSIRLFVVAASPPETSHCLAMLPSAQRATSTAPYPPAPLVLWAQAPSVQTS